MNFLRTAIPFVIMMCACSSSDAQLGAWDASSDDRTQIDQPETGADTTTEDACSISSGGPSCSHEGGAGGSGGGDGASRCADASTVHPLVFCPSKPSAVEGAPCTDSDGTCALCSTNPACCRHLLWCQSNG